MLIRKLGAGAMGAAFVLCAACAEDKVETLDGGLGYAVEFPSRQAAVATESLKIYAFDAGQNCLELMQARRTGAQMPPALAETQAAAPCAFLAGTAGREIELAAGDYVLLAVGQRASRDFLLGCSRQSIDASVQNAPISLGLADATEGVPETSCALLADKCSGQC